MIGKCQRLNQRMSEPAASNLKFVLEFLWFLHRYPVHRRVVYCALTFSHYYHIPNLDNIVYKVKVNIINAQV